MNAPRSFPDGSVVKNLPANAGHARSIPRSGRCPAEGNSNLLYYSLLGNPMDRGVWWAIVHGVAKESDMTYRLNNKNNDYQEVRDHWEAF